MENKLSFHYHEGLKIWRQLEDSIKMALTYSKQCLRVLNGLPLSLLMSYIYGAPSKARKLTSYRYIYGRDILLGIFLLEPCISLIYG
jgi:hypothetical protein